jgi:large subunit ribosomal protein L2
MGKNIISQKRGKGSSTYRSHGFRYAGVAKHHSMNAAEQNKVSGIITDLIHSSGHYAPLAKVKFEDGECLLIAPYGVKVGDTVDSGKTAEPKDGNTLPLQSIPEGTLIYNVESSPGDGGRFVRSSGGFARVTSKSNEGIMVMLPSKKERLFNPACRASIGVVAGGGRLEKPIMKAGAAHHKMRARGKLYPRTSAVSMNAVDHPYGTGRGSYKGGPTIARKYAPPGAKVGSIRPRRTGRRKK